MKTSSEAGGWIHMSFLNLFLYMSDRIFCILVKASQTIRKIDEFKSRQRAYCAFFASVAGTGFAGRMAFKIGLEAKLPNKKRNSPLNRTTV